MNILSQQPQDALQPSDYIQPSKETLVVIYRNFRVAYQALIKQTINKHIFSKEIQCPDCGIEYFKQKQTIPLQLSCGHVICEQCSSSRKHGQVEDFSKIAMNICASAKAVQNPYLNAHINKLIQERNDSLTKIECPKHPNNELQFYDQINSAFVCTDCILQPKMYQIDIVDSVKNMLFENKQHILKSSNDFLSKYDQQISKLQHTLDSLSKSYLQKQEEIQLQEGQLIQYIKYCANDQINQLIDQETKQRDIIQKELEVLRVAKVRALMPIIRLRNANEQDLAIEVKLEEDIQEIQKCKNEQSNIINDSQALRLSNEIQKLVLNLGEVMNYAELQ